MVVQGAATRPVTTMRMLSVLLVLATSVLTAGDAPAPVVASPAVAEHDLRAPANVRVSVLGADDGGEHRLSYTWTSDGPGKVVFAPNGSNAARQTVATFSRPGRHQLTCTIANPAKRTVTSTVNVNLHPRLAAIVVQPDARTISARSTQQFTAQAKDQFGQPIVPAPEVTWTVSDGGTITTSGLFTAGAGAGGPYWVAATINTVSGYAAFSINTPPVVRGLSAAQNPVTGTAVALAARADDDRGDGGLVYIWAVVGTPPAPVAFSANGHAGARSTVATLGRAGEYQVRCTVKDASGLSTAGDLTLNVQQTPARLEVAPAQAQVNAGAAHRFAARVVDQFGQPLAEQPTIAWVAGGGRIDGDGVFTAGPVAGGPWAVTASVGALTGSAEVTVNTGPRVVVPAVASANPIAGTRTVLSVRGADNDGDERLRYRWSVISPDDAPVTFAPNDSAAAQATTATFARAGSYRLLATISDPGGLTATSEIAVDVQPVLAALLLTPAAAAINLGGSQQFSVLARDQFGQPMPDRPRLAWSATGGTVGASGLFTANAGGAGAVTVRSGGLAASATLAINAPPTLAQPAGAEPHAQDATAVTLRVLGADDGGEARLTYRWTQLDGPAPLAFAANGGNAAKETVARCAAPGRYRVRVVASDADGLDVAGEVAFAVSARLATLTVHPAAGRVNAGGATSCVAVALDQFGRPLLPPPAITWSASSGTIAADGAFTAAGDVGAAVTVTAASGAVRATATIAINRPPRVVEALGTALGDDARSATARLAVADDEGAAGLTWTWSAAGPAPVQVVGGDGSANLRFAAAGTYQVQVEVRDAGGLIVRADGGVDVPVRLTPLALAPVEAVLAVGDLKRFTAEVRDQFGHAVPVQWSVDGGGAIDATGVFTAQAAGRWTVTARSGERSATAVVTVAVPSAPDPAPPSSPAPAPVPAVTP